jgi:site-specific DNA recombinase
MRTATYVRISEDRTGKQAGVDRQLADCTELATRLGYTVVRSFSDNDISAFKGKRRPGFEGLLRGMKAGEFDVVIVWHVDRLYRSLRDLVRLLEASAKTTIKTVNSGELDLNTSAGRMVATILGSVAIQESEHHAERRRIANDVRAHEGKWCNTGGRTFGYTTKGEPLDPEASLLREAADDVLAGHSLRSVARRWNDAGVTTVRGHQWTNLYVRRVLTNARIAGLRVHRGELLDVRGDWTPIVDEDVYHRLSGLLRDEERRTQVSFERTYMLSGVAMCGECEKKLYGNSPGRRRPVRYACRPSNHVSCDRAMLDAYVERLVLEHLQNLGIGRNLRARTEVQSALADERGELRAQRAVLGGRLDELAGLFATGQVNASQLAAASKGLQDQMHKVDAKLAAAAGVDPLAALTGPDDEPDTQTLVQRWGAAPMDVRGKLVSSLMTVTVSPRTTKATGFDPSLVRVVWAT